MADELDFSAPPAAHNTVQVTAQSAVYSPKLALEFFRATGTVEVKPAAKPIFSENEKSGGFFSKGTRMYLLLDGEIGLMIRNKFFGVVKAGEIFGELAVIAGVPRSATAMAKTECKVLSLDEKQFHAALQKTPEFALMMMSSMGQRMRQSIARLGAGTASAPPRSALTSSTPRCCRTLPATSAGSRRSPTVWARSSWPQARSAHRCMW